MNQELRHVRTLAIESEKIYLNDSGNKSKVTSPIHFSEMSAWKDDSDADDSNIFSSSAFNNPIHIRKKSVGYQEMLPLKKNDRLKSKYSHPTNEVVSAYAIAKFHPRYKEFFEKPLKYSKEKVCLPAINNKSLLSMYLPDRLNRKSYEKKTRELNVRFFQVYKIKEHKRPKDSSGKVLQFSPKD